MRPPAGADVSRDANFASCPLETTQKMSPEEAVSRRVPDIRSVLVASYSFKAVVLLVDNCATSLLFLPKVCIHMVFIVTSDEIYTDRHLTLLCFHGCNACR